MTINVTFNENLYIISNAENDIVLDPFSGTGTTAISAKRLGRRYIGFELDEKYAEISQQKLEQLQPNFKIGESWVSFYAKYKITRGSPNAYVSPSLM